MSRKLPHHLKANRRLLRALRWNANSLRAYYGVPVYLVGSALLDSNVRPRDWDVRIILSDADFERRYGISAEVFRGSITDERWPDGRWHWADDCRKQSSVMAAHTGVKVVGQFECNGTFGSIRARMSSTLQTRSVTPAAIAGVQWTPPRSLVNVWWTRQKL